MNSTQASLRMPDTLRHAQAMDWLSGIHLSSGQTMVLDASALRSFDSSALACMLELRRRAQAQGLELRIEGTPERVRRLVQAYGLSDLI